MVLEATVVCLDNSEWMRNGDYTPSRLEAQQDAINLICGAKTQSNPENTVAVIACSGRNPEVLVTLTGDLGKVLSSLHGVKVGTQLNFQGGIQVAQLALKHRTNKHQHQRVIFFVGSPLEASADDLVRLGKRLRKNGVAVDVVNFGEEAQNTEKLEAFIGAVSNNDNSHLVTIPPGPHILSDILLSSPIITGEEGGAGEGAASRSDFGFGVDPNMDPELALALKVSLEEEKARMEAARKQQEEANQKPGDAPSTSTSTPASSSANDAMMADPDDDLAQAIALSMQAAAATNTQSTPSASSTSSNTPAPSTSAPAPAVSQDVDMSEDDEMALALQMSMQEAQARNNAQQSTPAPSSTSSSEVNRVMEDPNFVNSVLATLPGVDPNDERIKSVLASLQKPGDKKDEKKDDQDKK